MISAIATGDDGTRILMLGVTRENITRLTAGKPIRVSAMTHPGFPTDLVIAIAFGETDADLYALLKDAISKDTRITVVPETKPGVQ